MITILNHHFTNWKTGSNQSKQVGGRAVKKRNPDDSSSALGTVLFTFSVALLVNLFFINLFFD